MRDRGPAGGESGGVERHARDQLASVLVRTEDQMRSLVSITANSDPSRRIWDSTLCGRLLGGRASGLYTVASRHSPRLYSSSWGVFPRVMNHNIPGGSADDWSAAKSDQDQGSLSE